MSDYPFNYGFSKVSGAIASLEAEERIRKMNSAAVERHEEMKSATTVIASLMEENDRMRKALLEIFLMEGANRVYRAKKISRSALGVEENTP